MIANNSLTSYTNEQYEKEMAELRREKALQYALDTYKGNGAASLWNIGQLIKDAAIVEKYLKDGE